MHLAIDIGATKTQAGVFSTKGQLIGTLKYETCSDKQAFEAKLFDVCDSLLGGRHPTSVGLAVPGLVAADGTFTSLNIGWQDYDLSRIIEKRYAKEVHVDNDVSYAGLAEARYGAATDYQSAVYVSLSTGLGTAIIVDGEIAKHMGTSESGLMLANINSELDGRSESIEDIVSGTGFRRLFDANPELVTDPLIWSRYAKLLSKCLFNNSVVFFPQTIVMGGGLMNQYARFNEALVHDFTQLFPAHCRIPQLGAARFINEGVLYGSYAASQTRSQYRTNK